MRLSILVRRDSNRWRAAFSDDPRYEHAGDDPQAAIWNLFRASPDRGVKPHTIEAEEPESGDRLRFSVEGKAD